MNQHLSDPSGESPLMHRATTHLSLVVGCYNAARHLEKRILELVSFLEGLERGYEVLIVEDHGVDGAALLAGRRPGGVPLGSAPGLQRIDHHVRVVG